MNKWVSVALCICGLGLGGMMLTNNSDGGRALIEMRLISRMGRLILLMRVR